jgi:hypothetical protein
MISMTVLESKGQGSDAIRAELRELCAAYLAADQWGRERTMATALRYAEKHPASSPCTLRLVSPAGIDQDAHFLDKVVNGLPLALVR